MDVLKVCYGYNVLLLVIQQPHDDKENKDWEPPVRVESQLHEIKILLLKER